MTKEKVIPILPCPDVKQQAAFYQQLGFELKGLYVSPNPYVVLHHNTTELHFYGTKKIPPAANSSMCYISVADVDIIYEAFIKALKKHTGKIPRTGVPRISQVRDLKDDRRFTLTDPGGNTFYIGSQRKAGTDEFFRTLENEEWAKKFTALYDVLYSKEDPAMAVGMLPKYAAAAGALNGLDKAKFLLLAIHIQLQAGEPVNDTELKQLVEHHAGNDDGWAKIIRKYQSILREE